MMKTGRSAMIALAIGLMAILAGCADEVGGVYVTMEASDSLQAIKGQATAAAFIASGEWTAKPEVDWLRVEPNRGSAGRQIISIISTAQNRTRADRTGYVSISSDGKQQLIAVHQRGDYALFDQKEYVVGPEGGEVNLTFDTNVERGKLMISYYRLDWIMLPQQGETRVGDWKGAVNHITVLPNDSVEERSTEFVLGFYNEKKYFLRLDTAVVRQLSADSE